MNNEYELVKLFYRDQSQGQKVLNVMLLIAFLSLVIPYSIHGISLGQQCSPCSPRLITMLWQLQSRLHIPRSQQSRPFWLRPMVRCLVSPGIHFGLCVYGHLFSNSEYISGHTGIRASHIHDLLLGSTFNSG